jgi:hypothetical protein
MSADQIGLVRDLLVQRTEDGGSEEMTALRPFLVLAA